MTTPSTELKTKQELVEKYNPETTMGARCRSGVAILGGTVDYGSAGTTTHSYIIGKQGEVRWSKSGNIVPGDILEMAVADGTLDIAVRNRTEEVRKVEDRKFLARYVAQREKYGYSEEEKMEIRAEFGDEEVVDVFTGKAIAL